MPLGIDQPRTIRYRTPPISILKSRPAAMLAIRNAALLAVLLICGTSVDGADDFDVVVVCADGYREALQPWLIHRTAQGHRLKVISSDVSIARIRPVIGKIAATGALKSVVLVGDCRPEPGRGAMTAVPTAYVASRAITRYGGEKQIATDNAYADLDGDHVPDISVGRLSADSPQQLTQIIRKIIAYESNDDFGDWRRQINLVAGVGGFGGLIDGLIENTTKAFLAGRIPPAYHTTMTQASWTSPYCPDPREFSETTLDRINEGCLFWIYMGHGNPRSLDMFTLPDRRFPILTAAQVPTIACSAGAPIAVFFSCYAGAFDAPEDCLAEEMLQHPRGPVAAIAGSRVTLPYAMAVMSSGLMKECFQKRDPTLGNLTLGDILLNAKRSMAEDQSTDRGRKALDNMGRLFTTSSEELGAQRQDHQHLFNLIGDPLLRVKSPRRITVRVQASTSPGEDLQVNFQSPVAGPATVELVVRRDRLTFQPPQRGNYDSGDQFLSSFDDIYRQANDPRLADKRLTVTTGETAVQLPIPTNASGNCHVRVFVHGKKEHAMGSANVIVEKAASDERTEDKATAKN